MITDRKQQCESTFISCASVNWAGGEGGVGLVLGVFYFSGSLKGKHKVKNSLQAGIVEKHLEGSNHQCELIL